MSAHCELARTGRQRAVGIADFDSDFDVVAGEVLDLDHRWVAEHGSIT